MIKDCKVYECNICGKGEIVEEAGTPNDIVCFESYNVKRCICKRCLRLAVDAASDKKIFYDTMID